MKILFLDPLKLNNKDGCDIHRIELIKNFSNLQNDVYVLVKNRSKNFQDFSGRSNINFIQVSPKKAMKLFSYTWSLISVSKKVKLDVLYTRNTIYLIFGIIFKKISKSIIIFEKNGIMRDELQLVSNKINPFRYLESIELFFLRYAEIVIVVTPLLKEYLVENGVDKKKIYLIENGANTDLFRPIEKETARKQLDLDNKSNYVCFVGNLAPWQGLEYLIKAVPKVIENVQVNFLIVGEGVMREKLERMVNELDMKDNITFTGLVHYDSVPLYMNASDVCVAPFIKERNEKIGLSPLKIYEYMACGKPVISSRIPNLEFIEEQNAGFLVEPEDPFKLADSIITFFKDDELKKIGTKSREYIMNYNSWKGVCERIISIYEKTVENKNN